TAENDRVDVFEMCTAGLEVADATVDDYVEFGKTIFHGVHPLVAQWRDLAVLLRAEAIEQGDTCVDDPQPAAAVLQHAADEVLEEGLAVQRVDADAALDTHRYVSGVLHGLQAVGH